MKKLKLKMFKGLKGFKYSKMYQVKKNSKDTFYRFINNKTEK